MIGRDITGEKCGMLTAIKLLDERTKDGKKQYLCRCDCGKERIVVATEFRTGKVFSCGCTHKNKKYKNFSLKDKTDKHIYKLWYDMKRRCEDPRRDDYERYGGRGIRVCEEWQSFQNFLDWSRSSGYSPGLTIDRIDNSGNYSSENCRWATYTEQANNKRGNHLITFNGKTLTMAEWARETGISYYVIRARQHRGWSAEKTLTTPVREVSA